MQRRTTIAADPERGLNEQSNQLVGYLEALFRRLMMDRKPADDAELEISREEIRALVFLDSGNPMTMTNLADSLGVPLSTATHTVDRLVSKGLAQRNRSEEDRRVVEVEMSEHGRKLQESFRDKRKLVARSWLEPLTDEERDQFLGLMAKITRSARPQEDNTR